MKDTGTPGNIALTRLRGFQDLLGIDALATTLVAETARRIAEAHNCAEIRTPVLERRGLYERSSGETSDVVQKQLYIVQRSPDSANPFDDQVLRPECTPGVIRAYTEAGLDRSDPEQRFFYYGPMYRYERPQKGRYREFYQFGVEILGRPDAACDAELIIMIDELRRELGLELEFQINSLGDDNCRPAFRQALLEWGRANLDKLCRDCHQRLEKNPLRLLDCKIDVEVTKSAPTSRDYLCEPCRKHFGIVEDLLDKSRISYVVNPRLVRGLDYYTRTTFEVVSNAVGAQSAVVAGGRYDGLVAALGGAPVPGSGFAIGVERIALALDAARYRTKLAPDAAIIAMGEAAAAAGMRLAGELRAANLRVEMLSPERGLKALLRRADKIGARYALIIGGDELARGAVQVRDLRASTQREVALDGAAAQIAAGGPNL